MSEREWGSLVLILGGLLCLAVTVWLRRGRSRRARAWMYEPRRSYRGTERMAILGFPVCGIGLLALGAVAIPEHAFGLEFFDAQFHGAAIAAALVTFALLAVPFLWWVLFLPFPDFLYPRWAREIRADRRKFPQTAPWQPPEGSDQL